MSTTQTAQPTTSGQESPYYALAALSVGAAVIHVAMFPAHVADSTAMGLAFAAAAWFQLIWAALAVTRPSRRLLMVAVAGNAAILAGWVVSRTVGLPFGAHVGVAEEISAVDALCTAFEVLIVGGAAWQLLGGAQPVTPSATSTSAEPASPTSRGWLLAGALPLVAVMGLTTAALASPAGQHGHDEGDDHAHGDTATEPAGAEHAHNEDPDMSDADVAAMGHDHDAEVIDVTEAAAVDDVAVGDAGDHADGHEDGHEHDTAEVDDGASPDITDALAASDGEHAHGAACTEPTAEDQAVADELEAATLERVAEYEDFAVAAADGYINITPEGRPMVHYARVDYMVDGKVLDPSAPESLMYAYPLDGSGPILVGAMYLNDIAGEAPPSPAGCIIQWHNHTNLCSAPGEGMVGVIRPDGSCPAGSDNRTSTQMTHVWTIDLPDGPFSHEAKATDVLRALRSA